MERYKGSHDYEALLFDNEIEIEENGILVKNKAVMLRTRSGKFKVLVSSILKSEEKDDIYLQALAHMLLGHLSKPTTIAIPKSIENNGLDNQQLSLIEDASDLVKAMKSGTVNKLWERRDFQVLYPEDQLFDAQIISQQIR